MMADPGKSGEKFDEYVVTIVEGSSAFTKRPSTAFRMAGIGMLAEPYCFTRIDTPPSPPISRPADVPIVGDKPVVKCAVSFSNQTVSADLGAVAVFELIHVNISGVLKIESVFDPAALSSVGDTEFEVIELGTHTVNFIVTYVDGQECKIEGTVLGEFKCDLNVTLKPASAKAGQTVTYTVDHGVNKSSLIKLDVILPSGVTKVGDTGLTSEVPGAYAVTFTADYGNGHLCEVILNVDFEEKPCDIITTPAAVSKKVGETFTIGINPGVNNTSGVKKTDVTYDTTAFELANPGYKALEKGTYDFKFAVTFNDGKVCEKVVKVVIGEAPCAFKAIPSKYTLAMDETLTINFTHANTSGTEDIVTRYPNGSFTFNNADKTYKALKAGAHEFEVTATYKDGQKCAVTFTVTVTDPPPNTISCGQEANGSSGFGEFTHQVNEKGVYYLAYDFLSNPDTMKMYVGGKMIYTTGLVHETTGNPGSPFGFNYDPADGALKIRMNDLGTGSQWRYTIYCPSSVPTHIKENSNGMIN